MSDWKDLESISYEDVIESNYIDMTPEKVKYLVNDYIDRCLHKIHADIINISSSINILSNTDIKLTDQEKFYYIKTIESARERLKNEAEISRSKKGIWKDLDFSIESLNNSKYSFDEILNKKI